MNEPKDIFDFLRNKHPKKDFFELYDTRDNLAKKLPEIEKVSSTRYKYKKLNHNILKDKAQKLLDDLVKKNYPDLNRIKKVQHILDTQDLRYYSQNQYYTFCYSDDFHRIYDFYFNKDYIKTINRYKKWNTNRVFEVLCLLDAFIDKYDSKIREQEIYSKIHNFRKQKHQNYIVKFNYNSTYDLMDWFGVHNQEMCLLITDVSEEQVIKRLHDDNESSRMVNSLSSVKGCKGYIKDIEFLELNKENYLLAKECNSKRHCKYDKDYDKWNMFK